MSDNSAQAEAEGQKYGISGIWLVTDLVRLHRTAKPIL